MREKEISEGLGDMAHAAEQDHEVQMARAELYKLAKYAIKLHYLLKDVSETEGLEGWVQSKITKSSEMISSVYHHMDYKEGGDTEVDGMAADALDALGDMKESKDTHCSDDCCGADVKAEDCTCSGNCSGCNCNQVSEAKKLDTNDNGIPDYAEDGKGPNDLAKGKKSKQPKKGKVPPQFQKESLKDRLAAKLAESACCSDCGNPSYKSVSEEKKKGSHGKVCWKGYRRGKGNSCHKVKGDG